MNILKISGEAVREFIDYNSLDSDLIHRSIEEAEEVYAGACDGSELEPITE